MIRRLARAAAVPAAAALLSGCLGDPPIEERWTLLELASGPDTTSVTPGQATPIALTARITYREILTGFVVAEVRASSTITADDVGFENGDDYLARARDVDRILQESTSLGFATRAVTGFDHLVQEIPLTIDAGFAPPVPGGAPAGSTAVAPGPNLFLLVYFGDVEEVEDEDGEEIEVVTPRLSEANEILTTGVELSSGGS
jgi:hypothetical protein